MNNTPKAILRHMIEDGANKHDLSVINQLYPNCVYHSAITGEIKGEALRKFVASFFTAFPDMHMTIEDQFSEGDKVVTRWSLTGTHKGEIMGTAPTNKQIRTTGICIDRVVKGKIVEEWEEWDALGLMRQIGLLPAKTVEEPVAA